MVRMLWNTQVVDVDPSILGNHRVEKAAPVDVGFLAQPRIISEHRCRLARYSEIHEEEPTIQFFAELLNLLSTSD